MAVRPYIIFPSEVDAIFFFFFFFFLNFPGYFYMYMGNILRK